jgi:hypothetical protein
MTQDVQPKRKRGRPRKDDPSRTQQVNTLTTDQAKQVVKEKRKRNRPDLANYGQEFIEPGDNRKYITFALESRRLPKVNFDNLDEVQERINWYFMRCAEQDMKPGVVGLANALGVDRTTLWLWKTGERRESNVEFTKIIRQAYGTLEEMWESYMQNGKISPPNGIFLGKNHFGYKDVQDVVVKATDPYADGNPEDVRNKYLDGVPTDTIPTDGKIE